MLKGEPLFISHDAAEGACLEGGSILTRTRDVMRIGGRSIGSQRRNEENILKNIYFI